MLPPCSVTGRNSSDFVKCNALLPGNVKVTTSQQSASVGAAVGAVVIGADVGLAVGLADSKHSKRGVIQLTGTCKALVSKSRLFVLHRSRSDTTVVFNRDQSFSVKG